MHSGAQSSCIESSSMFRITSTSPFPLSLSIPGAAQVEQEKEETLVCLFSLKANVPAIKNQNRRRKRKWAANSKAPTIQRFVYVCFLALLCLAEGNKRALLLLLHSARFFAPFRTVVPFASTRMIITIHNFNKRVGCFVSQSWQNGLLTRPVVWTRRVIDTEVGHITKGSALQDESERERELILHIQLQQNEKEKRVVARSIRKEQKIICGPPANKPTSRR